MTLSVLQSIANCENPTDLGHPTGHFGSGPTSGNLMIAMICWVDTSAVTPAAQNGWTASSSHFFSAEAQTIALYYKYAGASESTTQEPDSTAMTVASQTWAIHLWEISGVSGTWATDHIADTENLAIVYNAVTGTTSSFNTAHNNELVLGFFGANSAGPGFTLASGSYTQDSVAAATDGPVGAYALGVHTAIASSGTAVSTTITATFPSGSPGVNCTAGWMELQSAGTSTETGNVSMALGGVGFAAAENDHHAGTSLALHGIALSAGGGRMETGNVSLALGKLSFSARSSRKETGTGTLALGGVSIAAAAYDLNSLNPVRQFSTFG